MPRKPAHLRNEIFRRCAKLDQVSDASRRLKRQPIDEVRVIPQGRMLPNSIKVTAERGIRAWVLGLCNRLRKVAGVAEFDGAQCSEENVERLILWKLRSSVERGGRPLIWATVLHDESDHLRKIGLLVQPRALLAEIHAHILAPARPLLLKP